MKREAWRSWRLAGLALAAVLASGCGGGEDEAPGVVTTSGRVQGLESASDTRYLGIPYAAPPVGPLRWKAPTAPAPWSGVRSAQALGPHCAQPSSYFGVASTSEDCLYLNVYAPRTAGPHPVMVWIHGGAFYLGQSDAYDPSRLVAQNTVVVTLNYRLGALGFMSHAALSAEQGGSSGNYGLMDQQAALRWVRDNISSFGGDRNNVTLFGESAGGFSVLSHLSSAGSAGLFHKAIVMSGAYPFAFGQDTLAQAEAKGDALATALSCTDLACLRAVPVSTLLSAQAGVWPSGPVPSVDGSVLAQSARATLTAGTHQKVPVLNGSTHDEWRLFVAQAELQGLPPVDASTYGARITATLGPAVAAAAPLYPVAAYPNASEALGALGTDAVFACTARVASKLLAAGGAATYAYEFADASAPQTLPGTVSFTTGAAHSSELQYLFKMQTLNTAQQGLSDAMVGYWTRFARTGNPNPSGASTWEAYGSTDQLLSLVPGASAMSSSFNTDHKCSAVWTPGI